MMTWYTIEDQRFGRVLGAYEADNPRAAYRAMCDDAGEDCPAAIPEDRTVSNVADWSPCIEIHVSDDGIITGLHGSDQGRMDEDTYPWADTISRDGLTNVELVGELRGWGPWSHHFKALDADDAAIHYAVAR